MIYVPANLKEEESKSTFTSGLNLEYILKKRFDELSQLSKEHLSDSELAEHVIIKEENLNLNELIFIVPYSYDVQSSLLSILDQIENKIDNPKFLVAVNNLYENKENNTELYQSVSKVKKHIKTSVPNKYNIFFDMQKAKTLLIQLKEECTLIKHYSPSELIKLWKLYGGIQGDNITKAEYSQYLAYTNELINISELLNDTNTLYLEIKQ